MTPTSVFVLFQTHCSRRHLRSHGWDLPHRRLVSDQSNRRWIRRRRCRRLLWTHNLRHHTRLWSAPDPDELQGWLRHVHDGIPLSRTTHLERPKSGWDSEEVMAVMMTENRNSISLRALPVFMRTFAFRYLCVEVDANLLEKKTEALLSVRVCVREFFERMLSQLLGNDLTQEAHWMWCMLTCMPFSYSHLHGSRSRIEKLEVTREEIGRTKWGKIWLARGYESSKSEAGKVKEMEGKLNIECAINVRSVEL